jgi:hypothetical protein
MDAEPGQFVNASRFLQALRVKSVQVEVNPFRFCGSEE